MIQSKDDYREYYREDPRATGLPQKRGGAHGLLERRYRFYKCLRRAEYYTNCRKDALGRLMAKWHRFVYQRLCAKYQWTIPINVFGKGLAIVHTGTIVVTGRAKIGDYCRLHVCVNIGGAYAHGKSGAPVIGNNCYIAPGAKIFGPIVLGDNVAIGANAVVNSSFEEGNCTIAGIPAKKISDRTSAPYMPLAAGQGYADN